ncbi:hypothetical protein KKG31_04330 [Patescibacteria group bacterium]|nr:hypothetical protein [Patescibacteria group bacterium]
MQLNKCFLFSTFIFLILSVIFNLQTILTDGYHSYIDKNAIVDVGSFKEDFTSIFKSKYNGANLDMVKRIVVDWIFFFIDWEQYDKIRFALLTFFTFFIMYLVSLRIMEEEKYELTEFKKNAIAVVAAFFYRVNPLAIEHFIAYYPEVSYAIFPIAFYLIYMAFKRNNDVYSLLFGLVSAVLFLVVIHNAIYLAILACCLSFVAFLTKKSNVEKVFAIALKSIIGFVALAIFIILPVTYMSLNSGLPHPGYGDSISYVEAVGEKAEMLNIVLLDINLHNWPLYWGGYEYPFGDFYYISMGIIVAVIFFVSVYYRSFLSIVATLNFGVFSLLTNGVNSPIGKFYEWFIFNIEIGWLIRASPKFSFLLPMFFSLVLIHFLAKIASKKLIFSLCLFIIIIHQSIFTWPVWTGNMDGRTNKWPANPEIIEIIDILKNDTAELGKVAWFGDYAASSPRENIIPAGNRNLALRKIIDNENAQNRISELSPALEIKYLLIDKNAREPFSYFGYAKNAIPNLKQKFSTVYDGDRFILFEVNDNLERFYLPKAVFMIFTGYDDLEIVSSEVSIKKDIALIIGDSNIGMGKKTDDYVDIVIFNSMNTPFTNMNKSNIIEVRDWVDQTEIDTEWYNGMALDDTWKGTWLRIIEAKQLESDQEDFGYGLVFTSESKIYAQVQENGMFFSLQELEFDESNNSMFTERILLNQSKAIQVSAEMELENIDSCWVTVLFYNINDSYVGQQIIAEGEEESFNITKSVELVEEAEYFKLFVLAHGFKEQSNVIINNFEVRELEILYNTIDTGFDVNKTDNYEIFLRIFKSPRGGELEIATNDDYASLIKTESNVTGFEWEKIYSGVLYSGENIIKIKNKEGFNAINIGYYIRKNYSETYLDNKGIMYVFEAEKEFGQNKVEYFEDINCSNGIGVKFNNESSLKSKIHIYEDRFYYVDYKGKNISITIDDNEVNNEGMFLKRGEYTLDVVSYTDNAILDYIVIYDDMARNILEELKNGTRKEKGIVNYEKTGRTSYVVYANITEPTLLIFTAGYYEGFVAQINDRSIKPIPIYSTINAFAINETGNFRIEIKDTPQEWLDVGLLLSATSLILIGAYISKKWCDD